jgi:hypothetical protein
MTARYAYVLIGHSLVDDIHRGIVDLRVAHQHLLERVGPDAVEPLFVKHQPRPGSSTGLTSTPNRSMLATRGAPLAAIWGWSGTVAPRWR